MMRNDIRVLQSTSINEESAHIWPSLDQVILHDELSQHAMYAQHTHAQQHSQRPHLPIRVINGVTGKRKGGGVVVVVCGTRISPR
jgi:hypothetical protein